MPVIAVPFGTVGLTGSGPALPQLQGVGGLYFAGDETGFVRTRRAGCFIFEACTIGFLDESCPETDCISQVLAVEQERYN